MTGLCQIIHDDLWNYVPGTVNILISKISVESHHDVMHIPVWSGEAYFQVKSFHFPLNMYTVQIRQSFKFFIVICKNFCSNSVKIYGDGGALVTSSFWRASAPFNRMSVPASVTGVISRHRHVSLLTARQVATGYTSALESQSQSHDRSLAWPTE